jgi:hypothetical protein
MASLHLIHLPVDLSQPSTSNALIVGPARVSRNVKDVIRPFSTPPEHPASSASCAVQFNSCNARHCRATLTPQRASSWPRSSARSAGRSSSTPPAHQPSSAPSAATSTPSAALVRPPPLSPSRRRHSSPPPHIFMPLDLTMPQAAASLKTSFLSPPLAGVKRTRSKWPSKRQRLGRSAPPQ